MRKRKDGRWEARFIVGYKNGKPICKSVYASSQVEAEIRLKQAREDYEYESKILSRCPYLKTPYPTFEEWYDIWIEIFCKDNLKYPTYYNHKKRFARRIIPIIGNIKLKDLTVSKCQEVIASAQKDGLSVNSLKNIKASLQTCLQKAVDEGILSSNPSRKVSMPKNAQPEMKTLKASDLAVFFETAKEFGHYELFYLAVATGMRKGELLALTWDDLDVEHNTITINKTLTFNESGYVAVPPKTKSSNRTIAISEKCTQLLLQYKDKQNVESDIVFPNEHGQYQYACKAPRILHKILKKANLPDMRFHDLRHTFATLALENGMDIKTVSHMLGHTDAGFTMNTYMHVTDTMQQSVAESISALIKSKEDEFKE